MADFRFRAAAALDLRRDEERAAATVLARAEAALAASKALRVAAEARRRDAQNGEIAQARAGANQDTLSWHRNWIVGLSATVGRLGTELEASAAVVHEAQRAWYEARRKHLMLERLRERAWRRHQVDENRRELKAIDELARLRFVMPGFGLGGDEQ